MNHIHAAIEKIDCLPFTTLEGETMHSRIISVGGGDEEGILSWLEIDNAR